MKPEGLKITMIKVERNGLEVWEDEDMDELRKQRCICLKCNRRLNCSILLDFAIINDYSNAFMMTRCSEWIKKC